jgi:ribonuclease HI
MSELLKHVVIYTDGAAEPNPGPGGYGAVLMHENRRKELSGMFRLTTNNRMEIMAAVVALETLKEPCQVTLFSDSKYLVDAMTDGRVIRWRVSGWRRGKRETVANQDLWERLLGLCERYQLAFIWVKGHAGDPNNERCDELSMQFLGKQDLPADEGYENRPEADRAARTKVTHEGRPCHKCATPVVRKIPRRTCKPGQAYYFEYYLFCPNCGTMYMVDEAKRYVK